MNTYDELKNELLNVNGRFEDLFKKAESMSGLSENRFQSWKNTCFNISKQISEDSVRVAVVGPIKSGKSTFVNSLFRNDYLKRGAGVVTSIVTRIRCGEELKATIYFKPWDEINRDIEQGVALLPSWQSGTDDFRFDLRKQNHRDDLKQALDALSTEQLITNDSRSTNTVLLSSYLKGYESVKEIIEPDVVVKHYMDNEFIEHRTYAGDEVMAVYIKDIQLEINSGIWDGSIEIADCQGSDSPNPLHLALIQDYLSLTNFLVYVISSRTGLRRADIRFLSMIKEMGIMENMLFVVNCDFSEHESFEEFKILMEKIREEVSLIKPDPDIFTMSALYNLFRARRDGGGDELAEKDRLRLEQWERESEFSDLSLKETERFATVLNEKLTRERYSLLLSNHLARLTLMASGLSQWAGVTKEVIGRDSESAAEIIGRIKGNQEKTKKVSDMIRSTLDGAVNKVKGDVRGEVDSFFNDRSSDIISDIRSFVLNYEAPYDKYSGDAATTGFGNSLYLVYQDFKQALDTYITESVTPKIVGFIRKEDEKIVTELDQMTKPYAGMVEDALTEYEAIMGEFDIALDNAGEKITASIGDIDALKSMANLNYKPVTTMMSYSARVKAETFVRFGFYNVVSLIKKVFSKTPHDKKSDEIHALKDGLSRMKKETVANILHHFTSYRENIKFQYFFKFIDAVSNAFYDLHTERFQAYVTDLDTISGMIRDKKVDKENVLREIDQLEDDIKTIAGSIAGIKDKIAHL